MSFAAVFCYLTLSDDCYSKVINAIIRFILFCSKHFESKENLFAVESRLVLYCITNVRWCTSNFIWYLKLFAIAIAMQDEIENNFKGYKVKVNNNLILLKNLRIKSKFVCGGKLMMYCAVQQMYAGARKLFLVLKIVCISNLNDR